MIDRAFRRNSRALPALASAVLTVTAFAAAALAADLTADQKNVLSSLASYAAQIETNTRLAQEAAGPGDAQPTPAKARLVRVRLEQPKGMIPQVRQHLAKLPADNADVAALAKRIDAADAAIVALEARLDGKTAAPPDEPAPANPGDKPATPAPAPSPPAAGVKLDYKQEKLLKDTQFYQREIDGKEAALAELVKEVGATEDKTTIDYRRTQAGMNTAEHIRGRAKLMAGYLEQLPANGQGVAAAAAAMDKSLKNVAALEAKLAPVNAQLAKIVDPASYPTLDADVKRMQELARMYGDPTVLRNDPRQAAELVTQSKPAWEEFVRYARTYATLVGQTTEHGKRVSDVGAYFQEKYSAFAQAARAYQQELPAEIDAAVAQADKLVDQAVAEQKPAFFTGGVPQQMGFADDRLVLLTALSAEAGAAAKAKLDAARAKQAKAQDTLRVAIINANELPPDRYRGEDRDKLIAKATERWKTQQPDAVVVAARIPSEQWKRERLWRHTDTQWYLIDRSRLQVQLIVRHDDKLAAIRPMNMWIDHTSGDTLTSTALLDVKDPIEPQSLLLLQKVK